MTWPEVRLGDVLVPRNEIVHPRDNPTGAAIFVGLEHIEPNTGRRIGQLSIRLDDLTGRKARFGPGDIVYGYLRPYLNKVWLADFDGYCSVDQYVFGVRPVADPAYVAWFMRSPQYLSRAPIDASPGQLPRIRTEEVLSVTLPLPPLDEQIDIGSRLSGVSGSTLELADRLVDLRRSLAELRCSVGASLARGVTEFRPLGEVCDIRIGRTPSRAVPEYWNGTLPWASIGDLKEPTIRETKESVTNLAATETRLVAVPSGTLLFSFKLSIGKMSITERSMFTNEAIAALAPRDPDSLDVGYLRYALDSVDVAGESSFAVKGRTLNSESLARMKLPWMGIVDQRRIVAGLEVRLGAIDRARAGVGAELDALGALPAALLRRAFAG